MNMTGNPILTLPSTISSEKGSNYTMKVRLSNAGRTLLPTLVRNSVANTWRQNSRKTPLLLASVMGVLPTVLATRVLNTASWDYTHTVCLKDC